MQNDSYTCEICLLEKGQKLKHLFLRCPFAKNCWLLNTVNAPTWLRPDRAIRHIKRTLRVPFAMVITILMSWSIWKVINVWLFNGEDPSVMKCKTTFKKEFQMLIHRAKTSSISNMEEWLHNLN
jgi:hypothetical protein